jgi:hypothetical protein
VAIGHDELVALVDGTRTTRASLGDPSSIEPRPSITLTEWFGESYTAYADQFGKARYGDKTPGLVLHMPRVLDLFPDAVFIHLIRDGRDVAQAFVERDWGPSTIAKAALMWRRHVTTGRADGLKLPRGRYFELRYEDLVADPEPHVREICTFLELDYEPAMLGFQESAKRAQDYSPFPESHASLDKGITKGLRDWRDDMNLADRLRFEARAGATLEMCGYGVGLPQRAARSVAARARRLRRTASRREAPSPTTR